MFRHIALLIALPAALATVARAEQAQPAPAARVLGKSLPNASTEAAPDGALLVGVVVWVGPEDTYQQRYTPIVVGLELLYATAGGTVTAGPFGLTAATPIRLEAKSGYAVAGLIGRGSSRIDGFRLLFQRVNKGKLDSADHYESRWVGNRGQKGGDVSLGGDDAPIFGVRYSLEKDRLAGIALIQTRGQVESAPTPAVRALPMDQIAAAVTSSGGIVKRDDTDPAQPIIAVDRSGWKTSSADLVPLRGLTSLKRLDLHASYCPIRDGGAEVLPTLAGLEELDLSRTTLPDDILQNIRDLKQLKWLDLRGTSVSDNGIAYLKGLKNLETLRLGRTERFAVIGDVSMEQLRGLTNLREFVLDTTAVSDTGLEVVARFSGLKRLGIYSTIIGNDGLKAIEGLQQLEDLSIVGQGFTSEALRHIQAPVLSRLELDGRQFDDAVIPELRRFPKLKQLRILATKLSDDGLAGLNRLTELESIELVQHHFSGTGLARLGKLKNLKKLAVRSTPLDPNALDCLRLFPQLESLDVNDTKLPDTSLANLRHVAHLKELDLSGMRFSDEGLAPVGRLANLERLTLAGVYFERSVFRHLANAKKFTYLAIRSRNVADDEAADLGRLTGLRELWLIESDITGKALEHIGELTNLEALWLVGSKVSDEGAIHLAQLKNLQVLQLGQTTVGDKTLAQICQLPKLQTLGLQNTRITDAGLQELISLPQLRTLDVQATKVSREAIKRFQGNRSGVRLSGMFR